MTRLSASSVVVRSDVFVDAQIDGDTVAVSVETGACFELDPVSARVWILLERSIGIADMCDALQRAFDVDRATCEEQVLALLEDMLAQSMIEHRDG